MHNERCWFVSSSIFMNFVKHVQHNLGWVRNAMIRQWIHPIMLYNSWFSLALSGVITKYLESIRHHLTFWRQTWNVVTMYPERSRLSMFLMINPAAFNCFPLSGQYLVHLFFPSSVIRVNMTMTVERCSHTMRQKSEIVVSSGPWQAM